MKALLNYNEVNWSELFEVDHENSKSGLIWKQKRGRFEKGTKVGHAKKCGWSVNLSRKQYRIHRIIYILHNNYLSNDLVIDHIDGNPFNNHISNLRAVTEETNARNKGFDKLVGVRKEYNTSGTLIYRAVWYDNKVLKSKCFNTNKYGAHSEKLATEYRLKMIEKMGYTERHSNARNSIII